MKTVACNLSVVRHPLVSLLMGSSLGLAGPPRAEPWLAGDLPEESSAATVAEQVGFGLADLPLAFVENRGQWHTPARFVARRGGLNAHLSADAITYQIVRRERGENGRDDEERIRGANLELAFEGANSAASLEGRGLLPGRYNYFLGADRSRWQSDVRAYAGVTYRDLYAGIDLEVREQEQHLEYDLVLAPDADLEQVRIHVEGTRAPLRLEEDGTLVMETVLGPVRQPRPTTWQVDVTGEKVPVDCRYRLLDEDRFAFEVLDFQPGLALVIDPGLIYSTYLGGSSQEDGNAMALATDASGVVTVTGKTFSANLPITPGAFDGSYSATGLSDAFVTRINGTGSGLIFSTYLGGAQTDEAMDLAVDGSGATYVVGNTASTDFPVTVGAFDTSYNGGTDGFVTKLSATGSVLGYSTFLGAANFESLNTVGVDAAGNVTLAGTTFSPSFPGTAGSFQPSFSSITGSATGKGAFVTRLSGAGDALVWSTLLFRDTEAWALALSPSGETTVTGFTGSSLFPTTPGAYDTSYNGNNDVFVTRLDAAGATLAYSTYIGGTQFDQAFALGLDSTGAATVAGYTVSVNFPATPGAFDTSFNGGTRDGIVARLAPNGSSLVYATYLGGSVDEIIRGVAVDATGGAAIVGETVSSNYPTTADGFDTTFNSTNGHDVMLSRLSSTGALTYSTFLGGTQDDEGRGVAVDALGVATIAGFSASPDYPTTPGVFQATNALFNRQVVVTRLQIAVLDTTPPVVTITTPVDGAILGGANTLLQASIVDTGTTTVSSSPAGLGASLPAGGGTASGTVPLIEGANVLAVTATDAAGNMGGTAITVIRDSLVPTVAITSPAEGAIVGDSPLSLTISVADATATAVTFGTNLVHLSAGGGLATGDVTLVEGTNAISVTATDAAGNNATAVLHVVLDLSAPLITIDAPASGTVFGPGDSPVAVLATIDDLTGTTVSSTPAGVSAILPAGGGIATGAVALSEGFNTLSVTATDHVGRTAGADVVVQLDTTAPAVELDSPTAASNVRGTVDVHASAEDALPGTGIAHVDLSVDGNVIASALAEPYLAPFDTTGVTDGLHLFAATAVDGLGNTASSSLTARVDNTPPGVAIVTPSNGIYVSGTVPFDVSLSDGGSGLAEVTMLADGTPPSVDDSVVYATSVFSDLRSGAIDTTLLADGPLGLSATALDRAGNESTTTATVIVDNTAPGKAILTPLEGALVSGIMPITVSATDPNLATLEVFVDSLLVGSSTSSPYTVNFDTRSRLDGPLVVSARVTDFAGNAGSLSVNVTVDNMLMVEITPRVLHLKTPGNGKIKAHLEGANVALLVPPGVHAVQLRVPGGNAVPAQARYQLDDSDNDGIPNLNLEFDRAALIASIRAGIAAHMIQPDSQVLLTLASDGVAVASDLIRITGQ